MSYKQLVFLDQRLGHCIVNEKTLHNKGITTPSELRAYHEYKPKYTPVNVRVEVPNPQSHNT